MSIPSLYLDYLYMSIDRSIDLSTYYVVPRCPVLSWFVAPLTISWVNYRLSIIYVYTIIYNYTYMIYIYNYMYSKSYNYMYSKL